MNYRKIYNQLDRAGLIDKLLSQTNFDKLGIIKGIQYLEDFLNSRTFNDMKYWTDKNANKTICLVCTAYADLQIQNSAKRIDKFKYMYNTMSI